MLTAAPLICPPAPPGEPSGGSDAPADRGETLMLDFLSPVPFKNQHLLLSPCECDCGLSHRQTKWKYTCNSFPKIFLIEIQHTWIWKVQNIKHMKHLCIYRVNLNEKNKIMQSVLTPVKHLPASWFAVGHVPGGHLPHDGWHGTGSVRQRMVERHQQR